MSNILIEKDSAKGQELISCPFHKINVLYSACKNCHFFDERKEDKISCTYDDRFIEKIASVYPADGVRPCTTNDVVSNEKPTKIALDTIRRDIHEPSLEELAEHFGFTLEDITG